MSPSSASANKASANKASANKASGTVSKDAKKASQGASGAASSGQGGAVQSKYRMIKDGWGDRKTFQASFGLGMDPDSLEEGQRILESFQEADREASKQ